MSHDSAGYTAMDTAAATPCATPEAPAEFRDMRALFAHAVREAAMRPALVYFDGWITYAELDRASDALATWLVAKGVAKADRVAIVLQNTPQFVMMLVACWKIGAIPVPGNPMYTPREFARIFGDCTPRAVLCEQDQAPAIASAMMMAGLEAAILPTSPRSYQRRDDARVLRVVEHDAAETETLEQVMASGAAADLPRIAIAGDDIGLILYTSGTTGAPKGAMIRHRSLAFNGEALRDVCGLGPASKILAIAPLFHITGLSCHVSAALSARATLILHYRVEPSLLLDMIREHRPTFTIGAITAFNALMHVPGASAEDMASFDRVYSGGAPIPPALHAQIRERLGLHLHSAYGMTETTAQTHLAPHHADIPVDAKSGVLSIGKLTPGTCARVIDEAGRDLGPGEAGELLLRGPQIMAGYWNKAEESRAALADGWMHTGDVAFYDESGWYYLVDRMKDVIIASGFKVWPREVEDVLYTHPAVREAAVIGVADAYRGETVKACISLKYGCSTDAAALIEHCRTALAAYKVPRLLEILPELPKTVSGKIQRLALREQQ